MSTNVRRADLSARVLQAKPRLITIAAGAGWGKTYFGRELCAAADAPLIVSFAGVKDSNEAEERLTQAMGGASWERSLHDVAVLDEVDRLLDAGGSVLLERLVATLPAERTLAVISRALLAFDFSTYFAPHEIVTLNRDELMISRDEVREIIAQSYMTTELLERAVDESYGWPILTFLFARLATEGKLEEALADRASRSLEPLHKYVEAQVMRTLPEDEAQVVIACGALHLSTVDELSAAVGFDAQKTINEFQRKRYRFLAVENGRYGLLEGPEGNVRFLYPKEVGEMRARAAQSLFEKGRYVRAAVFAMAAGDPALATRSLDAAGRRGAGEVVSEEYQAVAQWLPLEYLFKSKHIFLEYFHNRRTRARAYDLHDRVWSFCRALTPDMDPLVRYSARIALTLTLRMTQRGREAEAQARECEAFVNDFPNAPDRRSLLRAEQAIIAATRGRLDDAKELWRNFDETETPSAQWYAVNHFETMFVVALQRADDATLAPLLQWNVEAAGLWGPTCMAQARAADLITHATLADRQTVRSMVAEIEKVIADFSSRRETLAFAERFTQPYAGEARYPTHVSCLLSIHAAFAQTDPDVARRLVQASIEGFDRFGHPYWQIAARLAAARLPGFTEKESLAECVGLSASMQAPGLQEQVRALADGRRIDGPYSAFLKMLDEAPFFEPSTVFRVRLLDGKVTRGGTDVRIRNREFELLARLANANRPVAAETLCEAMWPDSDERAAISALRMSVHRLRKQLDNSVVLNVPSGYQLGQHIAVDILEAEGTFVSLRRLSVLDAENRTSLHALFQYVCNTEGGLTEREPWYENIAHRIEDLRHGAGMLLANEYLRIGESLRALEIGEALLSFDELDEAAVGLCVRALTAARDKTAALRLWQQYVTRLAKAFGTKPVISMEELTLSAAP